VILWGPCGSIWKRSDCAEVPSKVLASRLLEIGFDHHLDQPAEIDLGLPDERAFHEAGSEWVKKQRRSGDVIIGAIGRQDSFHRLEKLTGEISQLVSFGIDLAGVEDFDSQR
jgi:hypothetical protein